MMKTRAFLAGLALAVTACTALPTGTTPAQVVFAAKTGYAVALTGAVEYESLARCSPTVSLPCSDPDLVAQLRAADDVANKALNAAEKAVRTPAIGTDAASKAAAAAQAALAAFEALVPAKKGKP